MHLVNYPKFCITIVSSFPWVLQNGYALFLGGAGGGGGWGSEEVHYGHVKWWITINHL